jgi:pimeloyl-ACP methyl ester carboxylesterase
LTTVDANGVALGIESFGDDDAPLVLLAGGTTMLSWPDALCERLAAGGRRVVRYDLRDSGESTTADPEAPAYTLRDLATDAAALADALGGGPAHLAGIGVGGMVAQVAALDHPGAFSALTLAGTRAVAPGPADADLPDHDRATISRLFAQPMLDWTDREAVANFAAAGAEILGDDPVAARSMAARIWDRTPGTAPPVQMANQLGMVFSKLDCKPRWRERLPEIEVPTLVVHGRRDRFFPVGNGEAIAREIPGARLLVLEAAATTIPDAAAEVADAMLTLGYRTCVPRVHGIRAAVGVGGSAEQAARAQAKRRGLSGLQPRPPPTPGHPRNLDRWRG